MPSGIRTRREVDSESEWLMTFSDVMCLLLAFFVMLLSVSEPKAGKLEAMKDGWQSKFVGEYKKSPFQLVVDDINALVKEHDIGDSVTVTIDDDGIQVEFNSSSLYSPGDAELKSDSLPILKELSTVMSSAGAGGHLIEVEGHTDDIPISNGKYQSNWELSSARSSNVVKYLISIGVKPDLLKASAFADTRPKVNLNGDDAHDKIARSSNRRVVIYLRR